MLTSFGLDLKINGLVATFRLEQTYHNKTNMNVECSFEFGLGKDMAVTHFEAERDGKVVVAELKKASEAKDDYDDAISMGHTGVIAERSSSGNFTISLGNLVENGKVTIRCDVLTKVEGENELLLFGFPSSFFPPPPLGYESSVNVKVELPGVGIDTMLVTYGGKPLLCPEGTFHSTARLQNTSQFLGVQISPKKAFEPSVFVENDGNSLAVALTFFPKWDQLDKDLLTPYVEAIFLVDRSGSMGGGYGPNAGGRIKKARETLKLFLSSLPQNCMLQIIGFGDKFEKLFNGGSANYNHATLKQAQDLAVGMQANLGGTNLLLPLKEALGQAPLPEYPRHIFILTDGAVSNKDDTISYVQKNAGSTKVHVVGIGSGADKSLVEGLANAGSGELHFQV